MKEIKDARNVKSFINLDKIALIYKEMTFYVIIANDGSELKVNDKYFSEIFKEIKNRMIRINGKYSTEMWVDPKFISMYREYPNGDAEIYLSGQQFFAISPIELK